MKIQFFICKCFWAGSQTGEYFGGSVAVADVNGDSKDDIIVGSPLFTYHTVSGPHFIPISLSKIKWNVAGKPDTTRISS